MRKANFDKNTTAAIKGIALILMFMHHFFAYPEWYISTISYPQLAQHVRFFRYSAKICVPVFAFLTGYFYAFSSKKTLRYSLGKIGDLLISYWTVFVPVLLFALVTGYRGLSAFGFILGLFGRNISLMVFCWYVSFYCLSMLMLPLLTRSEKHAPVMDILLLLFFPIAVSTFAEHWIGSNTLRTMIEEIRIWFPGIASGYLCAKYGVFDATDARLKEKSGCILLYALCICFAFTGRYFLDLLPLGTIQCMGSNLNISFTLDVFYAPAFVYGLSKLLQYIKGSRIIRLFQRIGDQSLLMWFIHCIFFNVSNEITQPILYWPKHPVFVVLFGLIVCYAAAMILSPAARYLIRIKNCLLSKWKIASS